MNAGIVTPSVFTQSKTRYPMTTEDNARNTFESHFQNAAPGICAIDITDSLIRGAIYSGATRIEISILKDTFHFAHDGNGRSIEDIKTGWERELLENRLDLRVSCGLDVAQLLFFAESIDISSQDKSVRLTLNSVLTDADWETSSRSLISGMKVTGYGLNDPLDFVGGIEGEYSLFRAIPIPVVINGVEVRRLQREGNDRYVEVDGIGVFVDLPSVSRGFTTSIGGIALKQHGVDSVVCMPWMSPKITPRMQVTGDVVKQNAVKAYASFKRAVGQVLLNVEADMGHAFVVEHYYTAILLLFPELVRHSEYISTSALIEVKDNQLPVMPTDQPYERADIENLNLPMFCDIPRAGKASQALMFMIYKMALQAGGVIVHPEAPLPVGHWLRKKAMSFRNAKVEVAASGNVVSSRKLLQGRFKLRISDVILLELNDCGEKVFSIPVHDWVLAEEATTGRLSSISRRDAYCQKVPVIHIKRNYSKLALPDFPSTTVEREILQAALLEAMEYLNAGT